MQYTVIRLRWRPSRSKATKGYPICTLSVSEKKANQETEFISVMGIPGTEDMIRVSALALWTSAHLGEEAKEYLLSHGVSLESIQYVFSQHGLSLTPLVQEGATEVYLLTNTD